MKPPAFRPGVLPLATWLISAATGVSAHAQTATPATPASDGGVIQLSPFVVHTEDDGWIAGNTLLSNRTNQPLKDVPVTIDSLTPEFLADVGAFDAYAAAQWSANAFVETEGQKAVRGTAASSTAPQDALRYSFRGIENEGGPTRNLFKWGVPSDTYNVERIDFGRGSNSLLFGDVEPGGQGNIYTKRAVVGRSYGSVLAQIGSFDSYRASFDYNFSKSDRWAARLNVVRSSQKRDFDFNRFDVEAIHGAATYRPFKNTVVRAEFETGEHHRVWGTNNLRGFENRTPGRGFNQKWTVLPDNSVVLNTDLPAADRTFNGGALLSLLDADGGYPRHYNWGPHNTVDYDFSTFSVYLEQRIGPVGLELAFNYQDSTRDQAGMKGNHQVGTDSRGQRFIDFTYVRPLTFTEDRIYRAMATYHWKPWSWMSQYFVATGHLNQNTFNPTGYREVNELDNPGSLLPATARVWYRVYTDAPGAYDPAMIGRRPSLPATANFRAIREFKFQDIFQYRVFRAYSLSATGRYFDGRLQTMAGMRLDKGHGLTTQPWNALNVTPRGEPITPGHYHDHPDRYTPINSLSNIDEVTDNYALTYRLTNNVNLYVSQASSFRAANGAALNFIGEPIGQQHGETYEVGIKSDFFNHKLVVNLNWYDLNRSNVQMQFGALVGITEDQLEELFNPNGLSTLDPKYVFVNGRAEQRNVFSKGYELTTTYQPSAGWRFRVAAAYKEVKQNAGMPTFQRLLAEAIERGNENPAFVAAAQNIVTMEMGRGDRLPGPSGAPFTFNYAASYTFTQGRLKSLSLGVNGNYNDNYLFNYLNNVPYEGGKRFSLHGMASYRSRILNRAVTYRLNVSNIVGSDYLTVGVVSAAGGRIRYHQNYGDPLSWQLTTTMDF